MLALDRPFVADAADCNTMTNQEISLEYGSATQLYLVPFIQHEEQVDQYDNNFKWYLPL